MTEQTPEQTETVEQTAQTAAVAQGEATQTPAPEVAKDPEAAVDPAAASADAPETEFEDAAEAPVHNPAALRGIQAGPEPHPRTRPQSED